MSYTGVTMLYSQPKFILKVENNKAFDNSSLVKTFSIQSGNIAKCLEHCLQDCRCQSFQICQNTKCQLCSSHKEENSSLLHDNDSCVYATYELRQSPKIFQVFSFYIFEIFILFTTYEICKYLVTDIDDKTVISHLRHWSSSVQT